MEQTSLRPTKISENPHLSQQVLWAERSGENIPQQHHDHLTFSYAPASGQLLQLDKKGFFGVTLSTVTIKSIWKQKKERFLVDGLQLDQFPVTQLQRQLCWQKRVAFSRSNHLPGKIFFFFQQPLSYTCPFKHKLASIFKSKTISFFLAHLNKRS